MRRELAKTVVFAAVAVVLIAAASIVEPEAARPEIFSDQGEPLFAEFSDVMLVKAIEVVAYDEQDATAKPLKVEFRNDRWLMVSHNDYPAEAGDRLAKTAAALVDLGRDLVVSDRIEDHATYGVIDPLDQEAGSLTGRGKRVVLRDESDEVLAELVLGKSMPDHAGYRYVRLPGKKRVYGVKTDADPSAEFRDWVEDNLLRIEADKLRKITRNSYSIDETFGRLANAEKITLTKSGDKWRTSGRRVPDDVIDEAVKTLTGIRVVGARPTPKPLAEQLRSGGRLQMTIESAMSLRQRGFFFTRMGLLANEGEFSAETTNGLLYTLRFGEIVSGLGAGNSGGDGQKPETAAQGRFVFVTVTHSADRGSGGEQTAKDLTEKFSDWYYVISGEDFEKLSLKKR